MKFELYRQISPVACKALEKAVDDIITNRNKIIEEYMMFWFANKVSDEELRSTNFPDRFVLCEKREGSVMKYWLEPKPFPPKKSD